MTRTVDPIAARQQAHTRLVADLVMAGFTGTGGIYTRADRRVIISRNPAESSTTPDHVALFDQTGHLGSFELATTEDIQTVLSTILS